MTNDSMPTREQLYNPILNALKAGGGSANSSELRDYVVETLNLSDRVVEARYPSGPPYLEVCIDWVCSELTRVGFIKHIPLMIWELTSAGRCVETVDPDAVTQEVWRRLADRDDDIGDIDQVPAPGDPEPVKADDESDADFATRMFEWQRAYAMLLYAHGFIHVQVIAILYITVERLAEIIESIPHVVETAK